MSKINVLSLQFTPVKADKQANLNKIKELIEKDGKSKYDLIVLPEFFDTGINITNNEVFQYAEEEKSSIILAELSQLAQKYSCYIHCGSICFKEKEKCFNRAYLLDRNGLIIAKYDKIHLFNYFGGNEGSYTTAGDKLCVIDTDFGKIGLATCFDIRFPQMFTHLTKMGAELFVLPATWQVLNKLEQEQKEQFIKNWQLMNTIRAYDNVAFLISANEVGATHPLFTGIGNSMIVNYDGTILKQADNTETSIMTTLDFSELRKARKTFPVEQLS